MRRIAGRVSSIIRDLSGIEAGAISRLSAVRLKCPVCGDETERPGLMRLDALVLCAVCSVASEFRELHEAWCQSRRQLLQRVVAEVPVWPDGGFRITGT
jgi:hypothetical protein